MKKAGRQVLFLKTSTENPRNGEGSFVRLMDNTILFAYTQFCDNRSGGWEDNAAANIAVCKSADEGETWSEPAVLFKADENHLNIMSVSFIRMKNGDIGIMYLAKIAAPEKGCHCTPYFRYSSDEGKNWSDAVRCTEQPGYYIINNDRAVQLKSGRIIFPVSNHGYTDLQLTSSSVRFLYSDDFGRSWDFLPATLYSPFDDEVGLQEPGMYVFDDGKIWAYFRTAYGHQYQSFSSDEGKTWSPVTPNFYFTSPDSPMLVKKAGKYTLAIFNPLGYSCVNDRFEQWHSPARTPYVCAVSKNGGRDFDSTGKTSRDGAFEWFAKQCFYLEDDYNNRYCYPALTQTADGFLVAYYHSNNTPVSLNSTKIIKITFEEIEHILQNT